MTQWGFQNKGKWGWTGKSSFVCPTASFASQDNLLVIARMDTPKYGETLRDTLNLFDT